MAAVRCGIAATRSAEAARTGDLRIEREDERSVLVDSHLQIRKVEAGRVGVLVAENEQAAARVVGDRVLDFDLPVMNTAVHHLETGHDVLRRVQDIRVGDPRTVQILFELEGDLAFGARLNQLLANRHRTAIRIHHLVGEVAEVRLKDPEHFLHSSTGHADFLADDLLAVIPDAPVQHPQGDVVGVFDPNLRPALG